MQFLRGYLWKCQSHLQSEASKESKEIDRIVRVAVKSLKLAHRGFAHMYSIYVCSKITKKDKRTNNLQAVKNYSVPQERKRHSTKVVQ